MARYFFDTSALVKYYHDEAGSGMVREMVSAGPAYLSGLGFVEMQSAMAMKVRSGAISQEAAGVQRARFLLDIASGALLVYASPPEHFASAARWIGRFGFSERLRTLDALQLAVAAEMVAFGLVDEFVVADEPLAAVGTRAGLRVVVAR